MMRYLLPQKFNAGCFVNIWFVQQNAPETFTEKFYDCHTNKNVALEFRLISYFLEPQLSFDRDPNSVRANICKYYSKLGDFYLSYSL